MGLCYSCLWWSGWLCWRRCAAGGCAHAVLVWGGVSRGEAETDTDTDEVSDCVVHRGSG